MSGVCFFLFIFTAFQIFGLDPYFFKSIKKKGTIIMHPGDFMRHAINHVYKGLPPLHWLLLRIDRKARGIVS